MKRTSQGVAVSRWMLVKNALLKTKRTEDAQQVSVRRFTSFDLAKTSHKSTDNDMSWFVYRFDEGDTHLSMDICHCDMTREDISSFNNTGNVCVWPSEEVLAYYCLRNRDALEGKDICELGGGMTCLAGLVVAMTGLPRSLLLTDGNEKSTANIARILKRNRLANGTESKTLRWDSDYPDLGGKYDLIICADCLFFDEFRASLVRTLDALLSPNGEVWIMAPTRGTTLCDFVHLAGEYFSTRVYYDYDPHVTSLHKAMSIRGKDVYDADLHYPLLVKLNRTPK